MPLSCYNYFIEILFSVFRIYSYLLFLNAQKKKLDFNTNFINFMKRNVSPKLFSEMKNQENLYRA